MELIPFLGETSNFAAYPDAARGISSTYNMVDDIFDKIYLSFSFFTLEA